MKFLVCRGIGKNRSFELARCTHFDPKYFMGAKRVVKDGRDYSPCNFNRLNDINWNDKLKIMF